MPYLEAINRALLEGFSSSDEPVMVVRVEQAKLDEMWSFGQLKKQQRWLWHAIDHNAYDLRVDPPMA